ncbi:MAG: NAD-dependent epimerase/dehydratase [Phycisphaeraceae bacterium]|nr:NAD-dependent epimerase/dehydratase [Phycisphaeraceae bacterium]
MEEKVLVTGGAGYLGSVLVPELLKTGCHVTVLDSFVFQQNSLMDCCDNERFTVVRGDCRDESLVREVIRDKDYVIPLAALVGAPLCKRDRIGCETTNTGAVQTLCKHLASSQRMIIPITNSGYGVGQEGVYCTEESPLNPISLYGQTKVAAEVAALQRENSISLRLATVFGASPRMRLDLLVNDFTYRALNDRFIVLFEGHFKRNYIHIKDVARAFLHAMGQFDSMKSEAYNVGLSDSNLSKIELCDQIKELISDFVYLEADVGEDPDKRDYVVSNEKIEGTGFKPVHSLQMGIKELIKCYTVIVNSKYSNV